MQIHDAPSDAVQQHHSRRFLLGLGAVLSAPALALLVGALGRPLPTGAQSFGA